MTRVVLQRLLLSVPVLLLVSALSFVLVSLTPGSAAQQILGPTATADQIAALNVKLGLDRPLVEQYTNWLGHALRGDLGSSLFTGEPVSSIMTQRLPVTLSLVTIAIVLSVVLGASLGIFSALRGGLAGRFVDVVSLVGFALPPFWVALVLVSVFALNLNLLPATGYASPGEDPVLWLRSLVLPVLTLAVGLAPALAKVTRDAMLDVLGGDFVRVLEANGFSRRSLIFRHVLRNAAIPVVTMTGVLFVAMLSGTVFAESVFSLPGLGGVAVAATLQHDLPVIQAAVLMFTVIALAVNLLIDLTYGWLDPRVRAR